MHFLCPLKKGQLPSGGSSSPVSYTHLDVYKRQERKSPDRITEEPVSLPEHTRLILAAPAENLLAQDPAATLGDFQRQGFLRVYWNGEMRDIEEISLSLIHISRAAWGSTRA